MSETPRHPIVAAWLIGDTDAGGCISELARELAAVTAKLEEVTRGRDVAVKLAEYQHTASMERLARAERAEAKLAEAERDVRRLELLEACIRDGSFASIFNDIISGTQMAYQHFGPGPALRTIIDMYMPDAAMVSAKPQPFSGPNSSSIKAHLMSLEKPRYQIGLTQTPEGWHALVLFEPFETQAEAMEMLEVVAALMLSVLGGTQDSIPKGFHQ